MEIGPLRHPRPVTVADLHLELEKEQEAVVCFNFLLCTNVKVECANTMNTR